MKRVRVVTSCLTIVLALMFLMGCGAKTERWAYNHEPEKEILALSDNGKAVYKEESYTFTKDDKYIHLKTSSGVETDLRYFDTKDGMTVYETSTYKLKGEGSEDGVVGHWEQDNGWVFEFTAEGVFNEDNFFSGHYSVNEADNSIKLMYDEPIEDAILYFERTGDELTIEYPWPMVPVQDAK